MQLAKKYPNILFLGIDIQGERIWKGAKEALENKITNAYFLRIQIENIREYIHKESVNEIWITFPDPFPRERQSKKRLTSLRFLEIYKGLLKKKGIVNLKTDSDKLYEFTLENVRSMGLKIEEDILDIYGGREIENVTDIQTTFEKKHLNDGKRIKYLRYSYD